MWEMTLAQSRSPAMSVKKSCKVWESDGGTRKQEYVEPTDGKTLTALRRSHIPNLMRYKEVTDSLSRS